MLFRSNDTATTEIYTGPYTLSLHDALPILQSARTRQSEHVSAAGPLESRRTRARQAVSEEQARYRELDAKVTEFEREIGPELSPTR